MRDRALEKSVPVLVHHHYYHDDGRQSVAGPLGSWTARVHPHEHVAWTLKTWLRPAEPQKVQHGYTFLFFVPESIVGARRRSIKRAL